MKQKILASNLEDLENLVIGDHGCSYGVVCETLANCDSSGPLWSKLEEIARMLEYPEGKYIMINCWLSTGTKTHFAVLLDILLEWKAKKSNDANLQALIEILEGKWLQSCADALRIKFGNFQPSKSTISETTSDGNELPAGCALESLLPSPVLEETNSPEEGCWRREIFKKVCISSLFVAVLAIFICLLVIKPWKTEHNIVEIEIPVKSYLEYESKMKNIPYNYKANVLINASDPDDWGSDFKLTNIELVSRISISGLVPLTAIYNIFYQSAPNLNSLAVEDSFGKDSLSICNYTNSEEFSVYETVIVFNKLEELHFSSPACTNFFKLFVNNAHLPIISNFSFDMGNRELNEFSESLIKQVAHNSTKSLKTVSINGIDEGTSFWLFGSQQLPTLNNVSNLVLKSFNVPSTKYNASDLYIHHLLNDVFPNVEKLELNGFEFRHSFFASTLSFMKSLVSLSVGVELHGMTFDLNSIPNQISKVDLYLDFKYCNISGRVPQLVSMNVSRMERMKSLRITSRCSSLLVPPPFNLKDNNK